ncbi:hypothetical protein BC937DRAFT_93792 [Endogone sp. FLAS-F59071]|nr:hypothetical protein BC937DRAFT_93792 [Endogone sp. FLAS-F59071]|eukprot:RUS14457.1 hypothetical protein BC937DRAFT_93792 [Endogone sp. FLAS-F59071]
MSTTPIEVTVAGLKAQVAELREILQASAAPTPASTPAPTLAATPETSPEVAAIAPTGDELTQIKDLQVENAKLKFRILHLLRALDAKDTELAALRR